MAISKEILDELLKDYKGPDDITGPDGLLKQLIKAVIERAMPAEMTEQLGFEKTIPRPNQQRIEGTDHRRRPCVQTRAPSISKYHGIEQGSSSQSSSPNTNASSRASMTRSCPCIPVA